MSQGSWFRVDERERERERARARARARESERASERERSALPRTKHVMAAEAEIYRGHEHA